MGTSTIFYLIRHGDVVNPLHLVYSSIRDIPLSDIGREQMKRIAFRISEKGDAPNRIVVSPMFRTRESAEILVTHFPEATIQTEPLLMETKTQNLVGRRLSFLKTLSDPYDEEITTKYNYSIESLSSQGERISSAIKKAINENRGSCFCIVGHGHPLASGFFAFVHPEQSKYTVTEMKQEWYPRRGTAVRLEVSSENRILSRESIG